MATINPMGEGSVSGSPDARRTGPPQLLWMAFLLAAVGCGLMVGASIANRSPLTAGPATLLVLLGIVLLLIWAFYDRIHLLVKSKLIWLWTDQAGPPDPPKPPAS
jgi:cell division protein FtsW (lipid II flippase)